MSIVVLCPSRGNASALFDAAFSFRATRGEDSSKFVPVVDEDDPKIEEYFAFNEDVGLSIEVVPKSVAGTMNLALNYAASRWAPRCDVLGFVGDDHRFRTTGWDHVIGEVLAASGGGIAYGNDLAQGKALPTQVFISSAIVLALGWMGLPGAKHLYLDNTWRVLGEQAPCLIYLPDIVIEHMHPAFGKGEWDENHVRVNRPEVYEHDARVFNDWLSHAADDDIRRVRLALRQ